MKHIALELLRRLKGKTYICESEEDAHVMTPYHHHFFIAMNLKNNFEGCGLWLFPLVLSTFEK